MPCAASTSRRCAGRSRSTRAARCKSTGDGLMVAFSSAAAAVRCGVEMQRATAARGRRLSVGLDAGEPLPRARPLRHPGDRGRAAVRGRRSRARSLPPRWSPRIAGPRVGERLSACGASSRARRAAVARAGALARRGGGTLRDPGPRRRARSSVVVADDQRPGARGLPRDHRGRARHPGGRGGAGRPGGGRRGPATPARRRADGHPHARARRPGGGRADPGRGRARRPPCSMLTTFDRDEYVYEALRIGASGFLLKDTPADGCSTRCASPPPARRCSRPRSRAG